MALAYDLQEMLFNLFSFQKQPVASLRTLVIQNTKQFCFKLSARKPLFLGTYNVYGLSQRQYLALNTKIETHDLLKQRYSLLIKGLR